MAIIVNLDDRGPKRPSLDPLLSLLSDDMKAVNALILDQLQSAVPLIPQIAGHLISAGGKRLRPLLALAAAKLCGYQGLQHLHIAAAIEFIHSATLLHDDVVDDSRLRRGKPSSNALWDNKACILVGDFLFSRAFQLMSIHGSLKIFNILFTATAALSEGEVQQLIITNDTDTGEQAYLEVIQGKTAALFAAAAQLGAVVAERPQAEEEALRSYGYNLGIAFQLIDDVLDYSARQTELGKTIGDDFREGKITLPVILAYRRGTAEEREFWHRCLSRLEQTPADLDHALDLMARHGALRDTVARARHYGAIAHDALGIFPEGPVKRALAETIAFCIQRAH